MKILDYKLVSKHFETLHPPGIKNISITVEQTYKEFEKLVNEQIEKGYIPLGGVSISYVSPHHILIQSLVLYED